MTNRIRGLTEVMNEYTPKILTEEDRMVENAFREMLSSYIASNHRKKVEIIERAYRFASAAHKGARRRSGEPYILHPIAVAKIVINELGLGSTSICAALLHDVVEDTEFTHEDIEANFGKKIADIVEGLTKISGGIFGAKASLQAENFRKLLLSMSTDIRVVLVKMADRLHNMRTLGSLRPEKQYKIAGETLYIYAPLAHRLGLFKIKTELEDLAFRYEHPQIYADIMSKISESENYRQKIVEEFVAPVRTKLDAFGFKYDIKARVKSAYSIYKKMENKKIPFEEVYDIYAVRVIFDNDDDEKERMRCWEIYTFFSDGHRVHPDRLRDWTSAPKANGYRALHLTAMGPDGKWIEVQIRSRKMDEIAELGYAAHWKYKTGVTDDDTELDKWVNTIKDILAHPEPNAMDFLDTIKLNLFASEIYVFTPKGDLITLPSGATVLDMAFAVHTELGMHCIAGKINHKLVPLNHPLGSGDQVEIITSRKQTPQPEWLDFCRTAKAKSRIRRRLRNKLPRVGETETHHAGRPRKPIDRKKVFVLHPDKSKPNYLLQPCCAPIPGDDVVGFVNLSEQVVLHKVSCPEAMRLKSSFGSRLVSTRWGALADRFQATVSLEGIDRIGMLEDIASTLYKKLAVNVRSLNISAQNEVFTCELSIFVDSTDTLENVIKQLKEIKDIKIAQRIS